MKKKPPPGATLIARLKERRLQRELPSEESQDGPVLDVEAQELEVAELEASNAAETESVELAIGEVAIGEPLPSAGNLLHANISIDELRPSTDDYDALTEEIKLAGRFAAIGLIAQGLRLARIRHNEIHRNHYTSFEDYCRAEHTMSATYAYRLIRMSEMAEKLAERPVESINENGPDPYEVMLNLGHRHLMALLPLSEEKVEEFLVRGVPLMLNEGEGEPSEERVPIDRATEKQIKQALKKDVKPGTESTGSVAKRAEKMLTKELPKLVSMLEQCAEWAETSPAEMELAKMERAAELKDLAYRFKSASDKIFDALSSEP